MKFNFKIQQYQTEAVEAVIKVFSGQSCGGRRENTHMSAASVRPQNAQISFYDDADLRNDEITLTDEQLLDNIRKLQRDSNIRVSGELVNDLGRCDLDIEMETGTGKTYVYIKTIFELNKRYGWSKFIVVVPSIAIREGVRKSFEMTEDHFMEHYGKKARYFVYSSSNLTQLDNFSSDGGINVMIINTQAFASSLKEGGKSKESRIIYSRRDEFGSRRPIDVIRANRPVIILDEPQKMGGDVTRRALKNFDPLFALNYSATHKTEHNMIYVLDTLEAYNLRLVKKIEVKGLEVRNFRGTDSYLYLEEIILSPKEPPKARIELEIGYKKSVNRETRIVGRGDDLYRLSREMEQYKGFTVSDIDPLKGTVSFINGETINVSAVTGDVSEKDMRRIQIRETIRSHFEKEKRLFYMGIKTLSLFFIDEVAKYRCYDENGEEVLGEYGTLFEQEYLSVLNDYITPEDTPYQKYLEETCADVKNIHKGYFSIDKKTGRSIDSRLKRGSEFSDDISAYDLILRNKERLLSFDEPTRFIFSHSALREGWDNPNVFQICTLKHSDSQTAKRQEVGRGLRLCVNQQGSRIDKETAGDAVHDINILTVIASESYKDFVKVLQSDIRKELYDRPSKATVEYFEGKTVMVGDKPVIIDKTRAKIIQRYLIKNDYIDVNDNVTAVYREDLAGGTLAAVPDEIRDIAAGMHRLIQAVFDESVLDSMISDGHEAKVRENPLNDNFRKAEFGKLWEYIRHKYVYTVEFDSGELIRRAAAYINEKLNVSELLYTTTVGRQKADMNVYEVERGVSFGGESSSTHTLRHYETSRIRYDLVGKIADGTGLTRKTAAEILGKLDPDKIAMFRNNPEEFIRKTVLLINEQKAMIAADNIVYSESSEEPYTEAVFTEENSSRGYDKAFRAERAVQDYVFTDGTAEESVERRFVRKLDSSDDVCAYAKLPRGFFIPTPVGNYTPDWAIAFKEGTAENILFIVETKGSADSLDLRPVERAKILCAKKLFGSISEGQVKYEVVSSFDGLLDIVMK